VGAALAGRPSEVGGGTVGQPGLWISASPITYRHASCVTSSRSDVVHSSVEKQPEKRGRERPALRRRRSTLSPLSPPSLDEDSLLVALAEARSTRRTAGDGRKAAAPRRRRPGEADRCRDPTDDDPHHPSSRTLGLFSVVLLILNHAPSKRPTETAQDMLSPAAAVAAVAGGSGGGSTRHRAIGLYKEVRSRPAFDDRPPARLLAVCGLEPSSGKARRRGRCGPRETKMTDEPSSPSGLSRVSPPIRAAPSRPLCDTLQLLRLGRD
jgi:hypothetical protein